MTKRLQKSPPFAIGDDKQADSKWVSEQVYFYSALTSRSRETLESQNLD